MQLTGQPMKALALFALLLAGLPARACLVKEILKPQLLVEQAQAIYHVRAGGYVVPLRQLPHGQTPKVNFILLGVIKGAASKEPLQFAGFWCRGMTVMTKPHRTTSFGQPAVAACASLRS